MNTVPEINSKNKSSCEFSILILTWLVLLDTPRWGLSITHTHQITSGYAVLCKYWPAYVIRFSTYWQPSNMFSTHSVPTSDLAGYITVNYKRVTDKRVVKPWISVTSIMVNPKWSGTPDDRHWVCSWLEHIPWYFFIFRYFRPFIYFILIMTEKTLRLLKFKTLTLSTFQLVLFLPDNIEATFHCAYAGFH